MPRFVVEQKPDGEWVVRDTKTGEELSPSYSSEEEASKAAEELERKHFPKPKPKPKPSRGPSDW